MNIQAYIESGILEEYVLGIVSPQEKQEVECMSHIYPEIKEELLRTESALEEYALRHKTEPPAGLKDSIFGKMTFGGELPEASEEEAEELTEAEISPEPVIDRRLESTVVGGAAVITPMWAKFAAAASIVLALLLGWHANKINTMKADANQMAERMDTLKKEMDYTNEIAQVYRNPAMKVIHLKGLDKSPQSAVTALWDVNTNDVMLDVRNLPKPPAGKQYQLWSIVNGTPVDIGMLDSEYEGKILKMKQTKAGPVAFAITLENEGGSPVPTMDQMFVMGSV